MTTTLVDAVSSGAGWQSLIAQRRDSIRTFLQFADAHERPDQRTSLRFCHRDDLVRCEQTLPLFTDRWWGAVVYTCFDSTIGPKAAAEAGFREPMDPGQASRIVDATQWPPRSVQNHRSQATLKRAKQALVSACERQRDLKELLLDSTATFDDRYRHLMRDTKIKGWGRTAAFDLLARTGQLDVGGGPYAPDRAYLAGSAGPRAGFTKIFGITVTGRNAGQCEEILRTWTQRWDQVAEQVGIRWVGDPYTSADFENALCFFQHGQHR